MKPKLRFRWMSLLSGLCLLGANGCVNSRYQRLANGDLQVACKERLISCLQPVADVCGEYGYDIVAAQERREVTGPVPVQSETISSRATVRCRKAVPLIGADPNVPPPPAEPPEATPSAHPSEAAPSAPPPEVAPSASPPEVAPSTTPPEAAPPAAAP